MLVDPKNDLRSAVAVVQALLQADPWHAEASAQIVMRVVEVSWPHEGCDDTTAALRALGDAVFSLATLALGFADDIVRDRDGVEDATPAQLAAFLADIAMRFDDDTPPAAA